MIEDQTLVCVGGCAPQSHSRATGGMYMFAAALASCLPLPGVAAARETNDVSRVLAQPAAAPAGVLPAPVRAMIESAIASGDKKAVETVLRLARQVNPGAGAEIAQIEQRFRAEVAARETKPASAPVAAAAAQNGFFDHLKGQVEIGASRSTGRSRSLGIFGALDLVHEQGEWRHKLGGRIDYQSSGDVTSADRGSLLYQPNYKVSDRFYGFGLLQYEHDRFAHYGERQTVGAGFGYGVLEGKDIDLDLEGGPTFRSTDPRGEEDATAQLVGRASLRLKWKITPTLQLAQDTAVYLESGASNATILTAVDTKLIGALKARFSYNVRYESGSAKVPEALDTQSRATLVYSF